MPPELANMLQHYSTAFTNPTSLPPPRSHDHPIMLMEGVAPVKVKPYCYPHSQKVEIENVVGEMLQEGII